MHCGRALSFLWSMVLLPIGVAYGEGYPTYKDGVLTVPSVNAADQVGKYQDLVFNYTAQDTWQLSSFKSLGTTIDGSAIALTQIYKIDVIKTEAFPVQVFLRVSGAYDPCNDGKFGQINQRLVSNRFDIAITSNYTIPSPPPPVPVGCLPGMLNFIKTIPLAVYGLSAGTYSYNVNGTTGTFTLTADNKYPGDVDGVFGLPLAATQNR